MFRGDAQPRVGAQQLLHRLVHALAVAALVVEELHQRHVALRVAGHRGSRVLEQLVLAADQCLALRIGLFGFLLVKVKFDNRDRYFLSPLTTIIALLWFVLCIARDIPPFSTTLEGSIPRIANSAHAVGLLVGAALAYAPLLIRKPA